MSTEVKVTWFDTAMALIEIGSVRLLTDPVFDAKGKSFHHGPVHLLAMTSMEIISITAAEPFCRLRSRCHHT